jgi:hypothetical protein
LQYPAACGGAVYSARTDFCKIRDRLKNMS